MLRQLLENPDSKTYATRSSSTQEQDYKIPGCGLFNAVVGLAIAFQSATTSTETASTDDQQSSSCQRESSLDIGNLKSIVSDEWPLFAGFEQQVGEIDRFADEC